MVASSLIGIAIKRIFRVRYAYFSDAVDFLNLYKRDKNICFVFERRVFGLASKIRGRAASGL